MAVNVVPEFSFLYTFHGRSEYTPRKWTRSPALGKAMKYTFSFKTKLAGPGGQALAVACKWCRPRPPANDWVGGQGLWGLWDSLVS